MWKIRIKFWSILNFIIFLKYEVVTQTGITYEVPTQFPAVTICNNDPFTTSNAELLYDIVGKENRLTPSTLQVNVDLNYLVRIKAANPSFGNENRKKLGFSKSIIMGCKFNERKCANELHWYYSFEYGNCWQFNVGRNFTNHPIEIRDSTLEGKEYGLSIVVFPLLFTQNKYMTNSTLKLYIYIQTTTIILSFFMNTDRDHLCILFSITDSFFLTCTFFSLYILTRY